MRRLIGTGLLIAVIFGLPIADAYSQAKKKADPKAPTTIIDSAKLGAGEFIGLLKSTPGADRVFTLEVEVPQAAGGTPGKMAYPNNGNANRIAQAQLRVQREMADLARARTPQERARAQQELARAQQALQQAMATQPRVNPAGGGGGGKVNMVKKTIEFQASEKVKVRTMVLGEEFDEKGNPKKLTKAELDALKGKDKTSPGYESSLEKLETTQKVRVVLAAAPKAAPATKDKDEEPAMDKRMQVKMIVILEGSLGIPDKGKAKKKKDK